ncbi:MAG: hypothetical protein WA989_03940 [Henriciella sp.]|uniref:hypothetical protein n=1 Tax=Henriciella sp. TaxID=1968823 RepID=UPI003C729482
MAKFFESGSAANEYRNTLLRQMRVRARSLEPAGAPIDAPQVWLGHWRFERNAFGFLILEGIVRAASPERRMRTLPLILFLFEDRFAVTADDTVRLEEPEQDVTTWPAGTIDDVVRELDQLRKVLLSSAPCRV